MLIGLSGRGFHGYNVAELRGMNGLEGDCDPCNPFGDCGDVQKCFDSKAAAAKKVGTAALTAEVHNVVDPYLPGNKPPASHTTVTLPTGMGTATVAGTAYRGKGPDGHGFQLYNFKLATPTKIREWCTIVLLKDGTYLNLKNFVATSSQGAKLVSNIDTTNPPCVSGSCWIPYAAVLYDSGGTPKFVYGGPDDVPHAALTVKDITDAIILAVRSFVSITDGAQNSESDSSPQENLINAANTARIAAAQAALRAGKSKNDIIHAGNVAAAKVIIQTLHVTTYEAIPTNLRALTQKNAFTAALAGGASPYVPGVTPNGGGGGGGGGITSTGFPWWIALVGLAGAAAGGYFLMRKK